MKFPKNIILDISSKSNNFNNKYWIHKYLFNTINLNITQLNLNLFLFQNKNKLKTINFLKTQNKFTLNYLKLNNFSFFYKNLTSLNLSNFFLNKKTHLFFFSDNFDINFLKKEKIYTKLKYSRVPQYDIVSGGVAALFAGFLGFLICEKFGFELLDSGDFYFFFMYIVFFFFFNKLLIKLINIEKLNWNIFSFKWLFFFYKNIIILILKKFKI